MHLVCFEHRPAAPGGRPATADRREVHGGDAASPNLDTLAAHWPGRRRLGALLAAGPRAGCVVDLNAALAVQLALDDAGAPEAEADSLLPPDPMRFLRRFEASLPHARSVLAFVEGCAGRWDAPDLARAGALLERREVRLAAPVPSPGKIVGVADNYAGHGADQARATRPPEPVLFLEAPSAVAGPEDDIVIPAASEQTDHEGELAAVIGRRGRDLCVAQALSHVAGYAIANDVCAREFQGRRGQHFIGKSCDGFTPLGPALVTADEIDDPQDLAITTRISGEAMQSARTKEMIFSVAEILAFASRLMTLEPGDVVLTGTPSGVGMERTSPRWLRDGDVVEIEIERLGRLHNYVRRAGP